MKLVTFGDDRRVGVLDGEEISVLAVPTMREYFERGGADHVADLRPRLGPEGRAVMALLDNLGKGAAGAAILNAELLMREGRLEGTAR